ncbi:hypothetical protein IAT40_002955 [Kwoniella sp. CBS 6097]
MTSGISTSQAAEFHASFQAEKGEIQQILEDNPNPPVIEVGRRISSLRAAVDSISVSIPLYDRGRYEKQLAELEGKLSSIRATERPKTKFSFAKSKVPAAGRKPVSTASTSSTPGGQTPVPRGQASSANSLGKASTPSSTYTISNVQGKVVRPPTLPEDTTTYTLSLSSLEDCVIDLRPRRPTISTDTSISDEMVKSVLGPRLTAIHGKGLKRCILIAPIVGGSALLDEVYGCVLVLGAQQFRIHSSSTTTILLHVASLPVIEHSKDLVFGPYPSALLSPSTRTGADPGEGQVTYESKHTQVQDFDWVRPGPSPHWRLAIEDPDSNSHDDRVPAMMDEYLTRIADMTDEDVEGILRQIIPEPNDSTRV